MSVKPIDSQVILHNTPNVANLQSHNVAHDENAQALFAQTMQKKIENSTEQVAAVEKSSNAKVQKKPEGERNNKEQQKKKDNKKNNNGEGSIIDIRV